MTTTALLERLQRALAPTYRVERELARGGMGVVFLAHHFELDRPVAIKVMRPELATAPLVERFMSESRLLAGVRHPNVVPIHHAGEADGLFYFVMDLVEGETLAQRLARGRLTRQEALKLGRDVLDGLEATHRMGLIHRDVKPGNIFLVGTRAVLVDFGIAKSLATRPKAGSVTGIIGTPGYMSPEQASVGEATSRSDLYSVGAVLYEALTGRGWNPVNDADWRGVPFAIARTLRRALAPKPDDRWPDARSFRRALWQLRARRYLIRAAMLTAGGLLAGVIGTLVCFSQAP